MTLIIFRGMAKNNCFSTRAKLEALRYLLKRMVNVGIGQEIAIFVKNSFLLFFPSEKLIMVKHCHPLSRQSRCNWYCDECGFNFEREISFYCPECDYDVCLMCVVNERYSKCFLNGNFRLY